MEYLAAAHEKKKRETLACVLSSAFKSKSLPSLAIGLGCTPKEDNVTRRIYIHPTIAYSGIFIQVEILDGQ